MAERETIPLIQAKAPLRSPPCVLVYATTHTPDFRFKTEDGEFSVKGGFNPVQREAFAAQIQKFMDENHEALELKAGQPKEKNPDPAGKRKALKKKDANAFLEDSFQPATENSKFQVPTYKFKRKATFLNKEGERKTMEVWFADKDGNKLDAAKLRTGAGSIIQLVYTPSLYTSGLTKGYALPSMRLEGVIVLKNEAWGGGSQGPGDVGSYDEAELKALMGEDIDLDDLSAFAASTPEKAEKKAAADTPASGDDYDPADDIPL